MGRAFENHSASCIGLPAINGWARLARAFRFCSNGWVGALGLRRRQQALLSPLSESAPFAACSCVRDDNDAYRLAYVGDLTPASGVADFLGCAIAWAARAPQRSVSVCWVGEGAIEGVLRAQPLPANFQQVFLKPVTNAALAAVFARTGLLIVPSLDDVGGSVIADAMLAGLPVLGSSRNRHAKALVSAETGWLFDPLRPGDMLVALDLAMLASLSELNCKRAAARARIAVFLNQPAHPNLNLIRAPSRSDTAADAAPA